MAKILVKHVGRLDHVVFGTWMEPGDVRALEEAQAEQLARWFPGEFEKMSDEPLGKLPKPEQVEPHPQPLSLAGEGSQSLRLNQDQEEILGLQDLPTKPGRRVRPVKPAGKGKGKK